MMKQARLVELRFAQAEMTERQNKLGAEDISSVLGKNGKWVEELMKQRVAQRQTDILREIYLLLK